MDRQTRRQQERLSAVLKDLRQGRISQAEATEKIQNLTPPDRRPQPEED